MQYTRLGYTGLVVSRLGFGAMTFGSGAGPMSAICKLGQQDADRLIGQCLDAGITYFNTADAYAGGQSEEILGRALGLRRKDVVIGTKVAGRTGDALVHAGLSRRHILQAADDSLRRLGSDYIDVYLVHKTDPFTPVDETLDALDYLARAGKVRYVGFSNWPAWLAAKAVGIQNARGYEPFRAAEVYYSLVGRELEHELVPFCTDAGIGITVWSPLAGGFLTGRYTRKDPGVEDGRMKLFSFLPFDRERGYQLIDHLKSVAAGHRATPAQIALGWLLAKRHVASVLIGASSEKQLADNIGSVNLRLSAEEVSRLDELTAPAPIYPGWYTPLFGDAKLRRALDDGK
jgi:aryl-alcohol dehydrogenase-like predicted oxidoreductase